MVEKMKKIKRIKWYFCWRCGKKV